jgi:hypothetical protein
MSNQSILLIAVSLGILVIGYILMRLTSSRSILVNVLVGSMGLLLAALVARTPSRNPIAYVVPFFVSMLFAGRALGTWWTSRKLAEWRLPSVLMFLAAGASLLASLVVFWAE